MLVSMMMIGSRFISTEAFSDNKTVNITGIFDPASGQTFTDTDSLPYGANLSMDLTGTPAGQTFAFWIENGIVKPAYAVDHVFTITNNMNLQVVFTPADKVVAVFMDTNGFYLGSRYVTSGGSADTSLIALPERPGFDAVDGAGRWTVVYGSESVTNITQNSVYVQNYVDDVATNTVNIVVNNGTGTEVKNFNSIVTAVANVAPEGQKFSHWEENGVKVSAQATYNFTALYNREITAVYVPVATVLTDEVIVTLSNDVEKRPGYHTYVGQLDIPSGYEVIEYGFFIGDNADVLDETHYSHVVQGTNIHPLTSEFVSSMSIGSHMSVRAYVVVSDGETQTIVKSEENHRYILENIYQTGFESVNPAKGSYTTGNTTSDGIEWILSDALVGNLANDRKEGLYSVRATANGYIQTVLPVENLDIINFLVAKYGTDGDATAYVHISEDGITWIDVTDAVGTISINTTTLQQITLNIHQSENYRNSDITANQLYVKISKTGGNRVNFDNVAFTSLYKGIVHDVLFDENNGSTNNQLVIDGQTISSYTPVKMGYTFDNWYEASDFSGSPYNFSTPVVVSLNLYAKWTINQYALSFDSNGGSAVTAITQDYNTEVTAPSAPTKTGYTFDGWYSDSGLTTLYSFTTMPASNLTLYAKWTINQYTITFDSNGGSAVTAITQDYNTAVSAPADPTKTDFTFSGWYTDNTTFENAYTFSTMPAGSITLYAKWVSAATSATVTYDSAGGSEVSSEVVTLNGLATEPTDPTREGYSFLRWTLSGVEWNFAVDTVSEDITLVAVWTINEYTISFDSNGGSSVTAITQDYGTVVTEPTDPTKTDYTFGGWYSDSELTSAYTFSTMPAENITLYAKWNAPIVYATDLFISEYIEGSSNNKAIEIYNGTGSSIDLSLYKISIFANGSSTASSNIALTGTLANGEVYVVANSSSVQTIKDVADLLSGSLSFNGDDAVVLYKNTVVIDSIGQVGTDPGSEWGSGLISTADNTIRRKTTIIAGDIIIDNVVDLTVEWEGFASDTFDGLGSHTINP